MKKLLLPLTLLPMLSACSDGPPPLDVVLYPKADYTANFTIPSTEVQFISKVDEIELQEIIANRGNCDTSGLAQRLPKTLRFGQKMVTTFYSTCEVAQIHIETDQGEWTFTFDH